MRDAVLSMCATSQRSEKPAIYGAAAAAEPRRRALGPTKEGDAAALEAAAAEMAAAASVLVEAERQVAAMSAEGVRPHFTHIEQNGRAACDV